MKSLSSKQKVQEEEYRFPYHYLDLYSDFYSRVLYRNNYSRMKIVKRLLQPFEGQSILDGACGDGRFCYELNGENVHIVGVDYSQTAIAFAKAFNKSGEFYVADLTELNLDRKFDCVVLMETLEHIPPDMIPKVILNLWRVLKDDERLIVTVPTIKLPVTDKHYQHFTMDKLEKLFTPLFVPIEKIGHCKTGRARTYWCLLQRCAILTWWLRKKVPGIRRFLNYVDNYYDNKIECCSLEEAGGFIVVFKKNPDGSLSR